MPTTPNGLTYPDDSGHTRIWEHIEQLATDTDDSLSQLVAGELVSAGPPRVRLRQLTPQTIPSGSITALTFAAAGVRYDTAGLWDSVHPTRLTAPVDGLYAVSFKAQLDYATGGTYRFASFSVNGSEYARFAAPAFGLSGTLNGLGYQGYDEIELNAGDYVEAGLYQDSGANRLTKAEADRTYPILTARWVAPLS